MMETGCELLVKHFLKSQMVEKNTENFLIFLNQSENPNVKLLNDVIFKYVLGYFILKAGIRCSNHDYFIAGKTAVAPLFFAKQHPLYRKVNLYLDIDLACMPKFMKNHFKTTVGVKVRNKGTDDSHTCEHFDFVVESVNKKLKAHLSWAPTNKQWLSACRTHGYTESMISNYNKWFNCSRSVPKSVVETT